MADSSIKNNYDGLHESLEILLDDIQKMHDIINVAQRGLQMTQGAPNAVKVLAKVKNEEDTEKHKLSLQKVERIADIAKKEIDSGFPFLYSQSSIMLYSYLEGAIKRFVIIYFKKNDLEKIKEVANIKIAFSEFVNLDDNEKFEHLFILYEKLLTVGMQYGVTRFENLLGPINFSGYVDKDLAKIIFELSQIRNVILHRGGKADKQFIACCPWLNYAVGDRIIVTDKKYDEYYVGVCKYVTELAIRLGEKRGKDMSEYKIKA